MLKQVRFKNFTSFTRETIISFDATKSEILYDTNTYNNILKGCCFYGSNASGKTNALNSISLLLDLLFKDFIINPSLIFTLFNKEQTMFFEYTFVFDDDEIIYYFEFNRKGQFTKEELTLNNKKLLTRLTDSAESFLTENKDYGKDNVDDKTLFLKKIYFNTKFTSFTPLQKWFDYLKNSIYYNPIREFNKLVFFDGSKIKELSLIDYLNNNGENEINDFFTEFNFPYTIKYVRPNNPFVPFDSSIQIKFIRKNMPDIPYLMESYGNKILLSILPAFLTIIKKGGILAIDEFSSGLHNNLEALLIKYFYKHAKNAQLVFVSHSTNLLKTSLLRPDQIYSVDFDDKGSFLNRFSNEKPRESQNLEKMYLSGSFGGIPLYESEN